MENEPEENKVDMFYDELKRIVVEHNLENDGDSKKYIANIIKAMEKEIRRDKIKYINKNKK